MKHIAAVVLSCALMAGCTSVRVQPVSAGLNVKNVCIEENTRTTVEDFLPVVRDGFKRHGVATRVVSAPAPKECEYVLNYIAYKDYDGLSTYLNHAELELKQNGTIVASAVYHLIGSGGMSLMKWQDTQTKMEPVIDELLKHVRQ